LGIGLSSRLKNTELFAEGTFNLGSELQTSVFKGVLNNDGTQTTLESYTYDENLRFVAIAFGLRRYFAHQ